MLINHISNSPVINDFVEPLKDVNRKFDSIALNTAAPNVSHGPTWNRIRDAANSIILQVIIIVDMILRSYLKNLRSAFEQQNEASRSDSICIKVEAWRVVFALLNAAFARQVDLMQIVSDL